ncbi:hypothetical protein BX257_1445 [Streptomyces sp. 3212.3]|nr:hypothetical protein BX257_1445 [Streptomyces sp. 3212.3]
MTGWPRLSLGPLASRDGQNMTDNEKAPVGEPVEDKLVDEVVERLMDRADASGAAWARAGC